VNDQNVGSRSNVVRWAVAAAPFGFAVAGPLLPLLIVFAGTLPAAAPHPPLLLAWTLAVLVTLTVVVAIAGLCVRGVQQFPAALWPPLIAVFGAQLVALALAVYPKVGLFSIATTLAGFVVLISAVDVLRDAPTRRAFLACYLASAAVAALAACALSVMKLPPAMFAYEHGRASGTFLQPNEFAGYLLFVIPIGLAETAAPRWLRALGLASAAAGTAGLLLSVSRAAIISLVLALVIFVQRFGRKATIGYVVAAAIVLVALVTVFRNVAHDPSENASRLAVWAGALRVAERFALTGVGPFGFHLVYPQFRLPEYSADEVHAHSLPLQLLIEYGVLGLAAAGWFVVAAIRQASATWRTIGPADRERSLLFVAIACGFVASALQNSIDVVTTFLLVIAWPMLGLLLALREPRRRVA
jgi:O-antigen ligase